MKHSTLMQIMLIFLLAISSYTVAGQQVQPAKSLTEPPNSNRLSFNHLALSVKNLDESAEFYKTVLGLAEITNKTKIEGIRWFSFGEGKALHLISIINTPVVTNKAVHMALAATNFSAFIDTLKAKNIAYSDWPGTLNKITVRADGIQQIYFQDPNGYWIEINSVN